MSLRRPEPLACEEAAAWLAGLETCADVDAYVRATLTAPIGTDHRRAAAVVAAGAWLESRPSTPACDELAAVAVLALREVLALPAWERRWLRPSERAAARRSVEDIVAALEARTG